jgi:phage repressor protein C with HTH and peptisase S24 domain
VAIRGRRNRRFNFEDATVEYRKHSSLPFLGGAPKVSPLINVSIGGLQFITEDCFDPGQRLDLKLMIPSAFRSLSVRAEVIWARRVANRDCYRTGVRFVDPAAPDVSLLRSLEEQYWAIPDDRKQQIETVVNQRYPLQGDEAARAGAPDQAGGAREFQDEFSVPEPPAPATEPPPAAAEEPLDIHFETEEEAAPPPPAASPMPPITIPASAFAAPPAPEPAEPLRIPLYDLVAGIESKKDAPGFLLQGVRKAYLVLPALNDPDSFALEVHDDSMHHNGSPNFQRGDVVLFSPNSPARSGDLAFAITRDGGVFRQVFFDANNIVRLRPLNGWHPERSFPKGEVKGLWKLIGKYKRYGSE